MAKVLKGTNTDRVVYYLIQCPGCGHCHLYDSRWTFNGDLEKPTFTPSYVSKYRHPKGYSNENPVPPGWNGEYVEEVCHSFLTDGKIQFLSDCTHELVNTEVELEEIDT